MVSIIIIYVETITILMCKQIGSNSFKIQITYEVFTYNHMKIYLTVCKKKWLIVNRIICVW